MTAPTRFTMMPTSTRNKQKYRWECKKGETGTYQGIAFEHQGHGIIEPHEFHGHYRRSLCPCEKAVLAQYKEGEQRREAGQQHQQRIKNAYAWIGNHRAPLELTKKTFNNFDARRQPKAFQRVQAYMRLLEGTLILHGSFGVGKTHLLAALVNALIVQGKDCKFTNVNNLFAQIQDLIALDQPYRPIIEAAIRAPLLVLDDMDKAKPSQFRLDILFEIIDARTQRGLPIAISTNRLANLADFVGGACASRLSIGQIAIEMTGADYRPQL